MGSFLPACKNRSLSWHGKAATGKSDEWTFFAPVFPPYLSGMTVVKTEHGGFHEITAGTVNK
ncbi:hypothetical protein J2W43_003471 [Pseudomonas brassicacearum]|uniref:Uncharacterized protein n=1 Tax=Pseudomonas brassicacearum TaxID=930166 RepID=A0AAW8MDE3_9PSED|nr:hypothetical protein [Pseudomonas brassicacearum]MDR6959474.1 hypothetical protein [Pseudomonas brassicacearum]